jgi:hypothetical protein
MFPVSRKPTFKLIDTTTVEIHFSDTSDSYANCPKILYRDIYASDNGDLQHAEPVVTKLPFEAPSFLIEQLEEGETYFFAVRIGDDRNVGGFSETVCVPLAGKDDIQSICTTINTCIQLLDHYRLLRHSKIMMNAATSFLAYLCRSHLPPSIHSPLSLLPPPLATPKP